MVVTKDSDGFLQNNMSTWIFHICIFVIDYIKITITAEMIITVKYTLHRNLISKLSIWW